MRSSIACARCRRSKVKCINNGVNTTCRACETSGRECTYPPPATGAGGGMGRRESIIATQPTAEGGNTTQGETPRRSRPKKVPAPTTTQTYSSKESPRPLLDALDPILLTPKVWQELFDIFQQHFSTDLPFIHPPKFLQFIRQHNFQSPPIDANSSQSALSQASAVSPLLLLAFLALTARFHSGLVAHHSPPTASRPSNPLLASEYYAAAVRSRLAGQWGDALGIPTLDRTQALLMLGLHEWGMCQGTKAWISVGVAVRSAQCLGLQFEQELDDMPLSRSLALNSEVQHMGINPERLGPSSMLNKGDEFIEQEIRRRTFWSCFIMDRYLSSGKYRPSMLPVEDLRIQLPSSERAFLFGDKVRTSLLGEGLDGVAGRAEVQSQRQASVMLGTRNGDRERNQENGHSEGASYGHLGDSTLREEQDKGRWEVGTDEGILSRFIKALELYGSIVKWSCAGGRRREKFPPWDERCTFFVLRRQLITFRDALPRDLALNATNISAHTTSRTSTPYTLLHTIHLLCTIILHREYVPFIPLRCSKPQGPLDPPMFPAEQVPPGFWEESARELFKAARDLVDLLCTCEEWKVRVETPIVGFAVYTAAFTGVYAINFPWMDPDGYMCKRQTGHSKGSYGVSDMDGSEAAQSALQLVGQMSSRLQMAQGWFKLIRRVHVYLGRMKKDFNRNIRALEPSAENGNSPASGRHLSLREGGAGGGLEEYKLIEKVLKEFGSLDSEDLDMVDADMDLNSSRLDQGSESGSTAIKSENMDMADGTPDSASIRQTDRWNAINSVAAAARADSGTASLLNGQTQHPKHILSPPHQPSSAPPPHHPDYQAYKHRYGSPPTGPHLAHATSYPPNPAESAQRASLNLQQHIQAPQHSASQPPAAWSPATRDSWSESIPTSFGGDDVAAFVSGNDWQDWAGMAAAKDQGGWMTTVWGGAQG